MQVAKQGVSFSQYHVASDLRDYVSLMFKVTKLNPNDGPFVQLVELIYNGLIWDDMQDLFHILEYGRPFPIQSSYKTDFYMEDPNIRDLYDWSYLMSLLEKIYLIEDQLQHPSFRDYFLKRVMSITTGNHRFCFPVNSDSYNNINHDRYANTTEQQKGRMRDDVWAFLNMKLRDWKIKLFEELIQNGTDRVDWAAQLTQRVDRNKPYQRAYVFFKLQYDPSLQVFLNKQAIAQAITSIDEHDSDKISKTIDAINFGVNFHHAKNIPGLPDLSEQMKVFKYMDRVQSLKDFFIPYFKEIVDLDVDVRNLGFYNSRYLNPDAAYNDLRRKYDLFLSLELDMRVKIMQMAQDEILKSLFLVRINQFKNNYLVYAFLAVAPDQATFIRLLSQRGHANIQTIIRALSVENNIQIFYSLYICFGNFFAILIDGADAFTLNDREMWLKALRILWHCSFEISDSNTPLFRLFQAFDD